MQNRIDRQGLVRSRSKALQFLLAWMLAMLSEVLVAQALAEEFGFPVVTSFGADNIGSDPATFCAIQGDDGVLYFGGNGLITFDGERWTHSPTPDVQWITSLDRGPDGKLWAAAHGDVGWFERLPNSKWQFHSLRQYLDESNAIRGQVDGIFAEGNGAVFVNSGRIYRWDGARMQSWSLPNVRGARVFRVKSEVWFQSYGTKMHRVGAAGPEPVAEFQIGTSEPAMVLWMSEDAQRWIFGTKEKLFIADRGVLNEVAPAATQLLRDSIVVKVTSLPEGRVLFCTSKRGIISLRPDGMLDREFDQQDGVPDNVTSAFVDREHQLWVLASNGIRRISLDPNTRIFDHRAGVRDGPYRSIAFANGTIAAASIQGALSLNGDNRTFSRVSDPGTVVEYVGRSPDGLLIAARRGLWLQTGEEIRPLGQFWGDVRSALASRVRPNETLASIYDPSIVAVIPGQQPRRIVHRLPVVAASMAEDNEGRLWIGTETRGVFVAPRNAPEPVEPQAPPADCGLPPIQGAAWVRSTPTGDVFVISNSGAWVKPGNQPRFIPVRRFPSRSVAAVASEVEQGGLWLVHSASGSLAACVARIALDGEWRWTPHSIADLDAIGAPHALCSQPTKDGGTVLWVGGTNAILRHVVPEHLFAPRPAAPLLHAFTRKGGGERVAITQTVPYSTPVVGFEFAMPQFARRAQLRLETRIDSIDSEWVPATYDSHRELTALSDGTYTVQARAVAETGLVSEPAVFTFTVAPPWWRTPVALVLYSIGFGTLVYGLHRLRIRSLRERNVLLEQKVRERTEELAEASAAKTLFVANMSHDIRNPLNGIVGLALALEDSRLDNQQREIVATLRECTTYLSSLVDDVLDFASIEAGRVELREGPFVPSELLNSVVTTLKAEAAERGAMITIETDPELPRILRGDAGRIQQILVNYVSNALKYSGGHVHLAASLPHGASGEVEFSTADEGPGISEADQATLFTKFSRLEGARRSHIPGTGLGLASCRLLADIMGGAVGVESQLGHGARFYLRLPLNVAAEPAAPSVDLTLPQATVLLVEDTDYNAMAATAVLRKLGLNCERARCGAEAIQLFSETRHNIVLLDRNLPDMDGTEVARRMREIETDGMRSVLLAVTAYCSAEDRTVCLKAGMDAFVGKPLTPEKLRRVLVSAGRQMLTGASIETTPDKAVTVDTSLLQYLAEGTEGGLAAQVERFVAALHEAHNEVLTKQARGASATELGDAAHRVLGQARMIGATALAEASIQLETSFRKGDATSAAKALACVGIEMAALTATLRRSGQVQKA